MTNQLRKKVYSLVDDGVPLVLVVAMILEIMRNKPASEQAREIDRLYCNKWSEFKEVKDESV